MRFRCTIWLFTLFLSNHLDAQGELTLPTLSNLLESDRYNPAISIEEAGWYLGLPSFAYNAFHTGPSYNDLIRKKGLAPILQIQNLANELVGDNNLLTDFRFQTVKLKRRAGNWSYGFEHEMVFHAQVSYPNELIQLYVNGNQPWIGQSIEIGPSATIFSYNNYAFPIAYQQKKVSLGIRPRLLLGSQFGRTPKSYASIFTSEEFYQFTLTTDYAFESVGIIEFEDANLLNYQIDNIRQWRFLSKHFGYGLDLGLQLTMSDQAKFALSVSDLGYIHWSDVQSYESDRETEYRGVEVIDLFELGQVDLNAALDSLNAIFDTQIAERQVRFKLPIKWHAHFSYQLNAIWHMSTSFSYQPSLLQPWNIGVIFTGEIKRDFFIGSSILNRYGDLSVGLHSTLKWGKFTGFLVSDQMVRGINPLASSHFNLRGGLNIQL